MKELIFKRIEKFKKRTFLAQKTEIKNVKAVAMQEAMKFVKEATSEKLMKLFTNE